MLFWILVIVVFIGLGAMSFQVFRRFWKALLSATGMTMFILCMLGFILLSKPAAADVTSSINAYFFTDNTFLLDDKIAIVTVNSYDEIIIDYGGTLIVVRNGTCQRVINNDFCVSSIVYDISKEDKKAMITVYDLGPDITLTRTLNKSNPQKGEGVKITVNMKNEGNTSVNNVTYIDLFPQEIKVIEIKKGNAKIQKVVVWRNDTGSWQNMTRVFWQGEILKGKSENLVYLLKPLSYIDSSFTAKVIYFDGVENVIKFSSSSSIKTKSFFEINKKFSPVDYTVPAGSLTLVTGEVEQNIYISEELLFVTEIINEALKNETINLSYIDFHIPDGLEYMGPISFRVYTNLSDVNASYTPGPKPLKKIGERTYRWNGLVNLDGTVIAFKLRGIKKGTHRLSVYANLVQFAEKKKPYYEALYDEDYYGYEEVNVKLDMPTIESNFKNGKTFDSGQQAYFNIYMQNTNEYTNFTNLKVVVSTPWMNKNLTFDKLKKTNHVNFFDGFVTMPDVTVSTDYVFKVNVTFETEYGEIYSVKLKRNIAVKPHSPIEISHFFSSTRSATPGEVSINNKESFVTLKLTNKGNKKIDHINVTEVIHPLLSKEGNLTKVVNIDKAVVMDVLRYKLDPVDIKTTEKYRITTYIDYVSGNETYHVMKDTLVEVYQKELDLKIKKTSQLSTVSIGIPFYVDYLIENNAGEELTNITLLFPMTQDFDMIGNRYYTIKSLGKGEKIAVIGKEKIMSKINGSSVKLEKAIAVFHDNYGNEFKANSSEPSARILYRPFQSPALKIERNVSITTINQSEDFPVTISVENIGTEKTRLTISDFGKVWDFEIGAGKKKELSYKVSENKIGEILLQAAMINYTYGGEMHYTASNQNKINVVEVKKEVVEEEVVEEKAEEIEEVVVEEKKKPYIKYIALVVFIIVVCIIIFSVVRMKPKKKRFKFLEE